MSDSLLQKHALLCSISEPLRNKLRTVIETHFEGALYCTRTWDAWSAGTMWEDDFEKFLNDPLVEVIINDIIATILNHKIEGLTQG